MGGHKVDARRGPFGLRASLAAIRRARISILTIAATYVISVAAGIAMVGTGNAFALERRDEVVRDAGSSQINLASRGGDHIRAAVLDFAANLVLGGGTSTISVSRWSAPIRSSPTAAGSEGSCPSTPVMRAVSPIPVARPITS
jgi:hypothetical protein